jgi:nitrite reductase/ring-hydroxylating ferredoxin subunit
MLSRRRLVRLFALFAASSTLPGGRWSARVLAQAQSSSSTDEGLLRIRLSDFPALQNDFGSVRIGTSPIGSDHYPVGLFYPVLINRAPGPQFYALDSACSHEGCTVPTLDPSTRVMQCLCHGSVYGIDGQVQHGPANFSLRQFALRYDGANSLVIEMPDVSFSLTAVQVRAGSGRIRLDFIAFDQIEYEVHFRPNLAASWIGPVAFSLTADGPADQTKLLGAADFASVFLDRTSPAGLYAVAMRTSQV